MAVIAVSLTLLLGCSDTSHRAPVAASNTKARPSPTSALPSDAPSSPAALAENALPGFPGWGISNPGAPHEIEGWAHSTSVRAGESVAISVSTTAPSFSVRVLRMGWYGGAEARLVLTLGPYLGRKQSNPLYTAGTRTYATDWPTSFVLDTHGLTPGDYLLRLEASSGAQRFVPLTIRGASAENAVVLINAVTTWAAYNAWGGTSLYHGLRGETDFDGRAYAVSFDRPYQEGAGAADFLGNELPVLALAERLGLQLQYITDTDLHADPQALQGARAVVSLGHDEYYSAAMRAHLTQARDTGTNIAFFGANAIFRRIRLQRSAVGADRIVVCYKRQYPDPQRGVHPSEVTTDWREPPVSRPESSLVGTFYECNPARASMIVSDATSWIWRGIVAQGTALPGVVGAEYDRVNPGYPTPRGIEVLTHSPVTCRGVRSFSDSAYYTTSAHSGVFSAGTGSWVAALSSADSAAGPMTSLTHSAIRKATTRILEAFSTGPAGREHPSRSNLASFREFSGDRIASGQASLRLRQ